MKKRLFFANKAPHYRAPLFNYLYKKGKEKSLDILFVFTHEEGPIKYLKVPYLITKGIGFGKYKIHLELIKIIKKYQPSKIILLPPDPLHLIDNFILFFYCGIKNIPYIVWTERWRYKHVTLKDRFSDFLYKFLLKKATSILVAGVKSEEWVLKRVKKNKIIIIPNVSKIKYNKEYIKKLRDKLIKKYKLKNKKIILYVGRLIKRKGLNYLISAFSNVRDVNSVLIIVGSTDFYKLGEKSFELELKKQVKNLGLKEKIIFVGHVNHPDIAAYYSLADIFVYPSVTEKIGEPWGLALNEAMQFGLPLITTDAVGAAYDLIKNGKNGFIIPEKNTRKLQEKIEELLKNEKLRKKMGEVSLKHIFRYNSYKKMGDKFLRALK